MLDHVAAAARRAGERAREQHHGGGEAARARAVHRGRAAAHQHRRTTTRSRRTASRASTRARRSSSSPTSASTRSRRPPRRRRIRSATCRSAFSAGWRSARVIYIIIGFVLTGMVPYQELGKAADPLAYALKATGHARASAWIVALGAVFSMAAVLLVFQYGQPRIFFAMARDGLLPRWAAKVQRQVPHVPYITTLITGVVRRAVVARSATRARRTTSRTSERCSRSRSCASA